MEIQTVMLMIAIAGCFVGLAGWLYSRDKRIINDAEWRGEINGKLDAILGINNRVEALERDVKEQGKEIAALKSSAKQAHNRIDELKKEGGK